MTTDQTPPTRLGAAPAPAVKPKLDFTTDRAAALPDLTRRPASATTPARAPAVPAGAAPKARATPPADPTGVATTRGRTRRRRAPVGDGGTGVYVSIGLKGRLRTFLADHPGTTYTSLALDAIDATDDRLADLLAPDQPQRPEGSMFAGRAARRRRHEEPQVQVTMRFAVKDLAIIDDLVGECRAPNRSALIAVALETYLDDLAGDTAIGRTTADNPIPAKVG